MVLRAPAVFDAFQNATDAQRTFREIMYLQALATPKQHPNIIRLRNFVKAENDKDIVRYRARAAGASTASSSAVTAHAPLLLPLLPLLLAVSLVLLLLMFLLLLLTDVGMTAEPLG